MTTDDELRALIALGEKATARPWVVDWDWHIDEFSDIKAYAETPIITGATLQEVEPQVNADRLYMEAAANLTPDIARELIEARELPAKITEISELASEMWYRLVIIANDMNNWEVYLEFVDPSDEGIEGESISVYADTMIAAIDKAIRRLKCGDL